MTRVRLAFLVLAMVLAARMLLGADADAAREIQKLAGIRVGLCLHLGCGRESSPGLTAALAEQNTWLVHGMALDEAALARARKEIEARGVAGRAKIECVPGAALPYLPNLANLAVVEDLAALAAQGISREEVLRVVAPGGVMCVREGPAWTKTVKPRPAEMDEWTHPRHGPDGNLVSTDKAIQLPLGLRWLDGVPVALAGVAGTRAWVLADGRCYALTVNEPENYTAQRTTAQCEQYLSVRDAFNGLPLWKMPLGTQDDGTAIMWDNAGALVAGGGRVYAVRKGNQVLALDGASGEIAATLQTKYVAERLLLLDGVLVASCWEDRDRPKGSWVWIPKTPAGSVEAFDARSGKPLWSLACGAFEALAADGVVYLLAQSGVPPAEGQVVAVDLQTGEERWRVPHTKLGEAADLQLNCAGKGYVAVCKTKEQATLGLAAADGKELWRVKSRAQWSPVVDGLIWLDKKCDPLTGVAQGPLPRWLPPLHCSPPKIVNRYMVVGNTLGEFGEGGNKAVKPESFTYAAVRNGCVEGMVPANGLLYSAQHNCKCLPGALNGFLAVGPSGAWPAAADFEKTRSAERGPGFGALEAEAANSGDWPAWRHDAERSGATPARAPEALKELWKVQATQPAEGPLAAAWAARASASLSPPIIAGGKVFVAETEAGRLLAFDAATGARVWAAALGSRVDSAPAFYRGLCLAGCRDGWVYALRAKDGQLAWRTCVAPAERRLVAYGQVESVWPAVGAVLVRDGTVFATAGRSSETDGGVALAALDAATGDWRWGARIGTGVLRQNDALAWRDGKVAWHYLKYDPATGKPAEPVVLPNLKDFGGGHGAYPGALTDGTWTQMRNRRAGGAFQLGKLTADLLAWNDALAVSPEGGFARGTESAIWASPLAKDRNRPVEALALGANAALFAGQVRSERKDTGAGFLCAFSAADGRKLAEFALPAPPVYDSLALAGGKVFITLKNGWIHCIGE